MWTPNQTKHMKRNNLHRAQISVTIHEVIVTIILILIITFKIILQSLGKSLEGHIFCYCESGFCGVQNLIGGKQILSKFSVTHIRTKNINFTVLITSTFNIYPPSDYSKCCLSSTLLSTVFPTSVISVSTYSIELLLCWVMTMKCRTENPLMPEFQ